MNKKFLVLVILCVFVLSSGIFAEEKYPIIEHLNWLDIGPGAFKVPYDNDYKTYNIYESGPLLTFSVPPSQKAEALFFSVQSISFLKWSDWPERCAICDIDVKLVSDLIPDDMEIAVHLSNCMVLETNNTNNYDLWWRKAGSRQVKVIMRRGYRDVWRALQNGQVVPDEDVIPILNELIDSGFDVEVSTHIDVLGALRFSLRQVWIEVTRLSKD